MEDGREIFDDEMDEDAPSRNAGSEYSYACVSFVILNLLYFPRN